MDKQANNTRVVNIRSEKYDVHIGRAGKGQDGYFGNPVVLQPGAARGSTLEEYKVYFYNRLKNDRSVNTTVATEYGRCYPMTNCPFESRKLKTPKRNWETTYNVG